MTFRTLLKSAVAVALWIAALVVLVASYNLYEPYLAFARPWARGAILVACCSVVGALWLFGDWSKRRIAKALLMVLWCLPLLAAMVADIRFQLRKQAVLHADVAGLDGLGQHFIIGYSRRDDVAPLVARGLIGGIYVTHHNIKGRTADDLAAEIAGLQALRRAAALPPLIVLADQEGGIVSHLSPQLTAVPALATLADLPPDRRAAKARELGEIQGRELSRLGVTINLAPVVDLRRVQSRRHLDLNSLISRRAISDDPSKVTEVASSYISGLDAFHVGATVKHFPGLGRASEDTHLFSAAIDTPLAELQATDWRPFQELLSRSNAHLMVGHAAVTAIDPGRPASHSKRVVDDLIRGQWGYQGLIITDDLVMGAIYKHGVCTAVVESLNAGVDLLLIAFDGAQYYRMFDCARVALSRGELDQAMLQKSLARLNALHGAAAIAGRTPQAPSAGL
jgi:beta-N-acetylhexosaminidase